MRTLSAPFGRTCVANILFLAVPLEGVHTVERLFSDALGHDPIEGACSACRAESTLSKTTVLVSKPRVLVLHLKRWDFIRARPRVEKIETPVSFEKLFPLDETTTYELCSVVVHHGAVGRGHYTAFVRAADLRWYHCDDDKPPRACSVREVLGANAYMLFYQQMHSIYRNWVILLSWRYFHVYKVFG